MTDEVPIAVPAGLRGLAAHDPGAIDVLREQRLALEQRADVSTRTIEVGRLGAMIALGGPADAVQAHVRRLLDDGGTASEVWGLVLALVPVVGVTRVVQAGPAISAAIEDATA